MRYRPLTLFALLLALLPLHAESERVAALHRQGDRALAAGDTDAALKAWGEALHL
jgi:hypothetical protein